MSLKTPISLFYARDGVGGGSTSFTIHLVKGMQMAGIPVTLYRFTSKPKESRTLASYEGIVCHFVTADEAKAIVQSGPSLLVAPEASAKLPCPTLVEDLMRLGMRVVIHDPNEFMSTRGKKKGVFNHLDDRSIVKDPICIRPSMKEHFPSATFIPHPYLREFSGYVGGDFTKRKAACSIARLTFVKRPKIILDTNRLLLPQDQIAFHSLENRLCTFALKSKYPELTQGGTNLPLVWGISAKYAAGYRYAVDMTYFPMDGGGSQYSFMEAWDAGCVNVLHKDWLRYKGEMAHGHNCYAVESAEEIASLIADIKTKRTCRQLMLDISKRGVEALEVHDPIKVARRYHKELTR